MTDLEYKVAVESLVLNGRGYQAISDLSKLLATVSSNYESVISECKYDRKLIVTICDNPNATNRSKVNDIRRILE